MKKSWFIFLMFLMLMGNLPAGAVEKDLVHSFLFSSEISIKSERYYSTFHRNCEVKVNNNMEKHPASFLPSDEFRIMDRNLGAPKNSNYKILVKTLLENYLRFRICFLFRG